MLRFSILILVTLLLGACTEVEFASHVTKNALGGPKPTPSQTGDFKIGTPYNIQGKTYYPKESYDLVETGIASWYGPGFHGKRTANGEVFDTNELTAAHRTLQMPSLVRVTNLENGRSVVVRVNDRGPFSKGRVIDVSERAASLLGFKNQGTAKVRLEVMPQESLRIAEMAKQGQSTKGTELAANQGRMVAPAIPAQPAATYQTASYEEGAGTTQVGNLTVTSVTSEPLGPVLGHAAPDGRFMPDPVVTQRPVEPTSIYVQAGSFTNYDNAQRLSQQLSAIGITAIQDAVINGQKFYRVRIGPLASVGTADATLSKVMALGSGNAIIVVD